MRYLRKLLTMISVAVALTSCGFDRSGFDNLVFDGELSLPVANLNISDSLLVAMFGDIAGNISAADDGILQYTLSDTITAVAKESLNNVYEIPTQSFNFTADLTDFLAELSDDVDTLSTVTLPDSTIVRLPISLSENSRLTNKNIRIDRAVFSEGTISTSLDSSPYDLSKVSITVLSLTDEYLQPITLSSSEIHAFSELHTLTPYSTVDSLSLYTNFIEIALEGSLPYGAIKGGELSGLIEITLNSLEYLEGNLAQQIVSDSTDVHYFIPQDFNAFTALCTDLYLASPELIVEVTNPYDIPITAVARELNFGGTLLELSSEADRIYLDAKSTGSFTISNLSTISLTQLSELLSENFSALALQFDVIFEPTDSPAAINTSDEITIEYTLKVPFDFSVGELEFYQDMNIELDIYDEDDYIALKELTFGFSGSNSMPLDFELYVYIKDSYGDYIEVLDNPIKIAASESVNQLYATASTFEGEDMIIENVKSELLEDIKNYRKYYIKILAKSKDIAIGDKTSTVKMYHPSDVNLKIIVGTRIEIEIDLLK